MRITFCLALFLISITVYSQSTVVKFNSAVPPSPNAAEFAKYGEIPVSTYTGVPNISIPLYKINNDISIELGYHAGGQTYIPYSCYIPTVYDELSTTTTNTLINTRILSQITFDAGKIEFTTSAREDLRSSDSTPQKLSSINIYTKYGTTFSLTKQFILSYDYFNSESGRDSYLTKRLKLTGLSEKGPGASNSLDHTISYNLYKLPDKDTKDIDHWGYYNGVRNNSSYYYGVRAPDATSGKAGLIESITYPTKGETTFKCELMSF